MYKMSYAHGATNIPLLGETIGANLKKNCRKVWKP